MNATAAVSLSMNSCAREFKNRVYVNVSEGASVSVRRLTPLAVCSGA